MSNSRKLIVLLCFTTILNSSTLIFAEPSLNSIDQDIKNIKNQAENAEKQSKSLQQNLNQVHNDQEKIKNDLMQIDLEINYVQDNLDKTYLQIQDTETELTQLSADLAAVQQKVKERDTLLKKRIKMMYEQGPISYIEVLLGSQDFGNFVSRLDAIQTLITYDSNLLETQIKEKNNIENMKAQVHSNLNELQTLYRQTEQSEFKLVEKQNEKKTIMDQLTAKEEDLEEIEAQHEQNLMELAQLMRTKLAEKKKIEDEIERKRREETERIKALKRKQEAAKVEYDTSHNGQYTWPLPGSNTITSYFGHRKDPFTGKTKYHSGMDIAAPMGTAIIAAESGRVIIAEYTGGYGNCIMIDHGGSISTLYGHIMEGGLLVSAGDEVRKGDIIAKVGSTGRSTGPHLHFEVRINDKVTDPEPYIQ